MAHLSKIAMARVIVQATYNLRCQPTSDHGEVRRMVRHNRVSDLRGMYEAAMTKLVKEEEAHAS